MRSNISKKMILFNHDNYFLLTYFLLNLENNYNKFKMNKSNHLRKSNETRN